MDRSTPEAQGVPSTGLLAFIEALDRLVDEPHSLMVLRRGQVIAEGWWNPYAADRRHLLFSLTKSFTSTAIGLAIGEGRLGLDDPVVKFFPGVAPAKPSRHLAALTVRHLLTMSTGRLTDSTGDGMSDPQGDWVRGFFRRPWLEAPGQPFVYDTGASHVLGAIVHKVTGEDLRDYLTPRLFKPLGIETPDWETDPLGRRTGGFGLSLSTEDIAKFGQLLLQRGQWQGKTLVSGDWVDLATSKQVDNAQFAPSQSADNRTGYGFQFWQCRHDAYRADGAFGQFCVVLPAHQTVVAFTAATEDAQGVLDLIWTRLLPCLQEGTLAPDPEAARVLGRRLAGLRLAPPQGERTSDLEARMATRRFVLEANPGGYKEVRFAFDAQKLILIVVDRRGTHQVEAGRGDWCESSTDLFLPPVMTDPKTGLAAVPMVSAFAWSGPRTLSLVCRRIETPFYHSLKVLFEGGRICIEVKANVAFGPKELPRLVGVERRV